MTNTTDITELTELLTLGVRIATGNPDAAPRPGQLALTKDIWVALDQRHRVAGIAPTGTGKSLAHMTAAALAAVKYGERTVISTNSLALQAQFMEKDLPVVVQAVQEKYQRLLTVAVLKGTSNYVDPVRVLGFAQLLLGDLVERDFQKLRTRLKALRRTPKFTPPFPGEFSSPATLKKLAVWALEAYLDDDHPGDRDSCPISHTTDDWRLLSASSEEKAAAGDTGYFPKVDAAKQAAGAADILVTNHTLLGVQAAQHIPVVFGSLVLGDFDHLIVDEAHTLPDQVRSRGAIEVSGRAILRCARIVRAVIDDPGIIEDAELIAKRIDRTLQVAVASLPASEDALRVPADEKGPLAETVQDILSFTNTHAGHIQVLLHSTGWDVVLAQQLRRAQAACDRLADATRQAVTPSVHLARWVTRGVDGGAPVFEASPVDVSGLIAARLWRQARPLGSVRAEVASQIELPVDDSDPHIPLGVACVSATLPKFFHQQVAIPQPATEYLSPFQVAYAESALFVPQALADSDIAALQSQHNTRRLSFDTYRHERWAVQHVLDLVEANQGSALVLAAKASSGKLYTERLRATLPPHITVYSQWDGGQVSRIVEQWRADTTSVLVGTKSLFTGVDAPGETATLIIIDRPPRAAKNVIDEARVELAAQHVGNRWTADRHVYVADAALLIDQGAGRLIRTETDRGMVAVLDPRLLTPQWSAFSYHQDTRHDYVAPLTKFGHKFNDIGQAKAWLQARRSTS